MRKLFGKESPSQRLTDLWALRLIEKADLWEEVATSDCFDSDDIMAHGVFRRLRDEINLATVIYRNAAFLETGDLSLGRFSLRNTAENPDEGTEALIESGKALEDFKIRATSGPQNASLVLVPENKRFPLLVEKTTDAIENLGCMLDTNEDSNKTPSRLGDLWKQISRGGTVEKWFGRTKPETFSVALAKLEAELKAGKPALAEYFACNLDEIAATFGLSTLEKNILCFFVTAFDTNLFGSVLKFFDFTENTNELIVDVIAAALDVRTEEIKAALRADSTLMRSGLVAIKETDRKWLTSRLSFLDNDRFKSLRSKRIPVETLISASIVPAPAAELSLANYAHVPCVSRIMIPYLRRAVAEKRRGANVLVYGLPGTGKTQLARAAADALGLKLYEVSTDKTENDTPRLQRWKSASVFLNSSRNALLAIDEAEDVFNEELETITDSGVFRSNKGEFNKLLETNAVPTFWITNSIEYIDPAMIRRFDLVIEVPTPDAECRRRMVEKVFGGNLSTEAVNRLAETERLAPAVLSRAAAVASLAGLRDGDLNENDVVDMIGETLRAQGFGRINEKSAALPGFYDPAFVNADLDLAELAEGLKSAGRGRLCLYGPPGTGKSAYAAWVAKVLNRPLVRKTVADLTSCYVGETEKLIAEAFREAERAKAVLLIDEADSFLLDRRYSQRSWETTQVNEMLAQLERYDGYFIATTNLIDTLDPASLRRFDLKAKFDFLKETQCEALAQKVLEGFGFSLAPEDAAALKGRRNLTPGDFAAVRRQAAFRRLRGSGDFVKRLVEESKLKGGAAVKIGF